MYDTMEVKFWSFLQNLHLLFSPELEKEGQESKISRPCWAVLTRISVFLSGLWVSFLLLFIAQKLD